MIETKVNLSLYQIKKIKNAFDNRTAVIIFLSSKQISRKGKYKMLLPKTKKKD